MRTTLLFFCLLAAAPADAALRVAGPRVRLSEVVAGVTPETDGDLGPAPAPGQRRRIYRQQLVALLGEAAGRRLPRYLEVETRARALPCASLEQLAREALAGKLAPGLRLRALVCAAPVRVPEGELAVTARLADGGARAGRLTVTLELQVGEWPAQKLLLGAEIDGRLPVVVAAVDLAAGAVLGADDLRVESRAAIGLPTDLVGATVDAVGKKLTTPLRAGASLRRGVLASVPLVTRGSSVSVLVTLPGLRISSRGTAREDGAAGDTINVLCQGSARMVRARVVAARTVVVDP